MKNSETATYFKQNKKSIWKCFEVQQIVNASNLLYVGKLRHSNNGVDEHEEEEETPDIEKSRKRHHQCEQQRTNSLHKEYFYTTSFNNVISSRRNWLRKATL